VQVRVQVQVRVRVRVRVRVQVRVQVPGQIAWLHMDLLPAQRQGEPQLALVQERVLAHGPLAVLRFRVLLRLRRCRAC
jgi:hypothetical protein